MQENRKQFFSELKEQALTHSSHRRLKFNVHNTNIKNKATGAIRRLNPLLKNHSAMSVDNGLIIYKMLIRPITTYASTVWGGTAKTNLNKVQTTQNRVLKLITDGPRYTKISWLHSELNVEYIKDYIIKAGRLLPKIQKI